MTHKLFTINNLAYSVRNFDKSHKIKSNHFLLKTYKKIHKIKFVEVGVELWETSNYIQIFVVTLVRKLRFTDQIFLKLKLKEKNVSIFGLKTI